MTVVFFVAAIHCVDLVNSLKNIAIIIPSWKIFRFIVTKSVISLEWIADHIWQYLV